MRKGRSVNLSSWVVTGWKPRRHWGSILGRRERWGQLLFGVDRSVVLRYVPYAGYLLVGVRLHRESRDLDLAYPHWEFPNMRKRTQDVVAPVPAGSSLADVGTAVLKAFPHLMKQLTVVKYDDGDPRVPGALFVSTLGSMWKVTVTEPDSCLKLSVINGSLDDALAGLELALGAESIPWEVDAYAHTRKKRK